MKYLLGVDVRKYRKDVFKLTAFTLFYNACASGTVPTPLAFASV